MFRLDKNKINYEERLGKGRYGNIYAYQKYPEDGRWAVKHIYARDVDEALKVMHEIVLGFSCDHHAILPIRGYHVAPVRPRGHDIYIKMPRMQGSLKDIIERHKQEQSFMSKKDIIRYFYALASGLEYLHQRKIAHRDIKPANILFDNDGEVKLGDIGVGKFVPEDELLNIVSDRAGAPAYIAPELAYDNPKLKKRNFFKADAWSLGIVIGELCLLEDPKVIDPGLPKEKVETYIKERLVKVEKRYQDKDLICLLGDLLQYSSEYRKSVSYVRKTLEEKFSSILVKEELY